MTVAKEHVEAAFAFVVVPDAFLVCVASVRVPRPVTLDDLVRSAKRKLGHPDRAILVISGGGAHITHDVAGAKGIVLKLRQVAGAIVEVAVLDVGAVARITLVVGTPENLVILRVFVQGTIRRRNEGTVCSIRPARRMPVGDLGKDIVVVVGVHQHREADLLLIAGALDPRGLLLRPAEYR